jgi:hypothetical protein
MSYENFTRNWECTKGKWDAFGTMDGTLELDTDARFLCLLADLGFELEVDGDSKCIWFTYYKGFSLS